MRRLTAHHSVLWCVVVSAIAFWVNGAAGQDNNNNNNGNTGVATSAPEVFPSITRPPGNQTVVAGQRLNVPCETEADPDTVTFTWFKDGKDVQTTNGYSVGRLKITSDGSLLIVATVKQDKGWYKCRPSNTMGFDEASGYINVIYLPVVLRMPSQVTWAKGHLQQLDCPVDSNPAIRRVTWDKNQIVLDGTGRFDVLDNGTLLVSNVGQPDAGSYRCTPYNVLGQGISSQRVQVLVKDPPVFSVRPDRTYFRQLGGNVKMLCEATGIPTPSVMWRKVHGTLDKKSLRVTEGPGYLEIRNLQKSDHGNYECVAANLVATVVTVTQLLIENTTPQAPYNVTVLPGLFDINIKWVPGYNGGQKTEIYVLWFRPVGDGAWMTMTIDGQATDFDLYSLQPNEEYEFKIMSRNSIGDGSFSSLVRAKTLGYERDLVTALPTDVNGVTFYPEVRENIGPRPSSPTNLTASVKDQDISLTWNIPNSSPVTIFSYRVQYRRDDGVWVRHPSIVRGGKNSSTVLASMDYGRYDILVQSYSVLAYSLPSNMVTVEIEDDGFVLTPAMIGAIIGGVFFLILVILAVVIAIVCCRKDKNNTSQKFSDVNYSRPDEMNGRPHQRVTPQHDRWTLDGDRDLLTAKNTNINRNNLHHHQDDDGIFFLPRTRHLDTQESILLAQERDRNRNYGRAVDNSKNTNTDRALNSSAVSASQLRNEYVGHSASNSNPNLSNEVPLADISLEFNRSHPVNSNDNSRSRSQPSSLRYRGQAPYYPDDHGHATDSTQHNRSMTDSQRREASDVPQMFSKSYSFPSHGRPGSISRPLQQHPSVQRHPSQSGDFSNLHNPSFQSEDDDVFDASSSRLPPQHHHHHHQKQLQQPYNPHSHLPRHSSMIPSHNPPPPSSAAAAAAATSSELNPPMFGVEDISSVLDIPSEHPSQLLQPSTSSTSHLQSSSNPSAFSPSVHHPSNSTFPSGNNDTILQHPSSFSSAFHSPNNSLVPPHQRYNLNRIPRHQLPSDSDSSAAQRPPYTRDQLQDVVHRLRQRLDPRSSHQHLQNHNVSGYSEPLPQNRQYLYDRHEPRMSSSHPHLPNPVYASQQDYQDHRDPYNYYNRGRPLNRRPQSSHHSNAMPQSQPIYDQDFNDSRPRALSEGTRGNRQNQNQNYFHDNTLDSSYRNSQSIPNIPNSNHHHHNHNPYQNLPQYQHHQHPILHQHPHDVLALSQLSQDQPQPFSSTLLSSSSSTQHRQPPFQNRAPPSHFQNSNPNQSYNKFYPGHQHGAIPDSNNENGNTSNGALHEEATYQRRPLLPQPQPPPSLPSLPLPHPDERPLLDSTTHSSGIGSRNTSQSTSSFHHPRGQSNNSNNRKVSMSLSSGLDPDLSLDTNTTPSSRLPEHTENSNIAMNNFRTRDTSTDENYEFDSINALERDIMADLRRYSQLNSNGLGPHHLNSNNQPPQNRYYSDRDSNATTISSSFSPPKPPRFNVDEDPNRRFERLREEFKHFRQQQQQHPQHASHDPLSHYQQHQYNQPPPQELPPGVQRLPMDSDML